jgi:hypothetical protein
VSIDNRNYFFFLIFFFFFFFFVPSCSDIAKQSQLFASSPDSVIRLSQLAASTDSNAVEVDSPLSSPAGTNHLFPVRVAQRKLLEPGSDLFALSVSKVANKMLQTSVVTPFQQYHHEKKKFNEAKRQNMARDSSSNQPRRTSTIPSTMTGHVISGGEIELMRQAKEHKSKVLQQKEDARKEKLEKRTTAYAEAQRLKNELFKDFTEIASKNCENEIDAWIPQLTIPMMKAVIEHLELQLPTLTEGTRHLFSCYFSFEIFFCLYHYHFNLFNELFFRSKFVFYLMNY